MATKRAPQPRKSATPAVYTYRGGRKMLGPGSMLPQRDQPRVPDPAPAPIT